MPMYDFSCPSCKHQFEDLAFDDTCPPCPHCGVETSRQISAPSPLKTGAFPFGVGPVHPAATQAASNLNIGCGSGSCGGGGFK